MPFRKFFKNRPIGWIGHALLVQPSIAAHRIFSLNFKLLFQWKDTENGRQLMKHMKVMEDFNKQSNRLAGGDPMGKYFWLLSSKFGAFFTVLIYFL